MTEAASLIDRSSARPAGNVGRWRLAADAPTMCAMSGARNVLGGELRPCSLDPLTGFLRDGCCQSGPGDLGLHLLCAQVTAEFLEFSLSRGNDLITPVPEHAFPGLKPGDRWCLCIDRWREALDAGVAPPVVLEATHISVLEYVDLDVLRVHALDGDPA